jgi:hypothetical protein
MGSRRLGRKRLYSLEKQGESLTTSQLGTGTGMETAVTRATRSREGQEICVEILLDLGAGSIVPGDSTANAAIGLLGKPAQFATWSKDIFGYITDFEVMYFEVLAGGGHADHRSDLELVHKASAVNGGAAHGGTVITALDGGAGNPAEVGETLAFSVANFAKFDSSKGFFNLASTGNQAAAAYSGGKLMIRIKGIADLE